MTWCDAKCISPVQKRMAVSVSDASNENDVDEEDFAVDNNVIWNDPSVRQNNDLYIVSALVWVCASVSERSFAGCVCLCVSGCVNIKHYFTVTEQKIRRRKVFFSK